MPSEKWYESNADKRGGGEGERNGFSLLLLFKYFVKNKMPHIGNYLGGAVPYPIPGLQRPPADLVYRKIISCLKPYHCKWGGGWRSFECTNRPIDVVSISRVGEHLC